jgi:hypothetical protein
MHIEYSRQDWEKRLAFRKACRVQAPLATPAADDPLGRAIERLLATAPGRKKETLVQISTQVMSDDSGQATAEAPDTMPADALTRACERLGGK